MKLNRWNESGRPPAWFRIADYTIVQLDYTKYYASVTTFYGQLGEGYTLRVHKSAHL